MRFMDWSARLRLRSRSRVPVCKQRLCPLDEHGAGTGTGTGTGTHGHGTTLDPGDLGGRRVCPLPHELDLVPAP